MSESQAADVLLCVGDLVEEILVHMPSDPVRGADIAVRSARVRGGSAANVAALDAELGGTPRFAGLTGDDHVGHTLVNDLMHRGVDAHVKHARGTGVIITMIGEGGRSRMIDRGASRRLSRFEPGILDGVADLYIAASAFTEDPLASAIDRLLGEVGERGIDVTIAGPSAAELESLGAAQFRELCLALTPAHVVVNRREHSALGFDPREAVAGATVTIVTNARRPTLVMVDGEVRSVEVPPVDNVRDRTGVGDGFLAGFLGARRRGADPVAATDAGHRAAAMVLRHLGPTTGAETPKQ